jgi:enoyl-CoA hydratase/carnithine racemase
MNNRVECEIINDIAHVRLARPNKLNAIDMDMFTAIDKTIKKLIKNRTIRAVIVSGKGTDFCSGLDVKSVMTTTKNPMKLLFKILPWKANLAQRMSINWQKIRVPVIAAIHGRCWGGGLQIVLGADIRISTADASFSIMEGRWGMIPDMGGSVALRELCSIDIAKEITFTSKVFDGSYAKKIGLLTHVSDKPLESAQELADEISLQSPDTIAASKKLYNKSWHGSAGMALFRETFYQLKIMLSKNFKIKTYNQTHDPSEHKKFIERKKW